MHFGTNVCANTFPFVLRSGAPLLKRKQLKLIKCRSPLSSLTLSVFLCDSLHRNTAHLSAHLHSRIVPLSFTPMIWGNGGISCSLRRVGLRGFLYYGSQINGPEWKWIRLSTESVLKYYLWERIIYFSSPVPKKQLQTWSLSRLKKKNSNKQRHDKGVCLIVLQALGLMSRILVECDIWSWKLLLERGHSL